MTDTTAIRRAFQRIEASLARRRTRRILENLPLELQRDVGFPACLDNRR